MYEQASSLGSTEKKQISPVLSDLHGRFIKLNDEQSDLLGQVEAGLHNILDRKTPNKDPEMTSEKSSNDYNTGTEIQLRRVSTANRRLEVILQHLREII